MTNPHSHPASNQPVAMGANGMAAPTHTFKDRRFHVSLGTLGSWGILQTTPQFVMNFLNFGMNVQEAIEVPRLRMFTGRHVQMEERFPAHVRRALEDLGYVVDVVEPWSLSVGGAQGIQVDSAAGVFQGGADLRRDGFAIGYRNDFQFCNGTTQLEQGELSWARLLKVFE